MQEEHQRSGRRVPPCLPLLCIASPAASPPRRTCGPKPRRFCSVKGCNRVSGAQRPLTDAPLGVAGSAGFARVEGSPLAMESGLGIVDPSSV